MANNWWIEPDFGLHKWGTWSFASDDGIDWDRSCNWWSYCVSIPNPSHLKGSLTLE